MKNTTAVQCERALLIQADLMEAVNDWLREGVEPQEVMAAIGKAAADTLISIYGPVAVAPWFTAMAINARSTIGGQN